MISVICKCFQTMVHFRHGSRVKTKTRPESLNLNALFKTIPTAIMFLNDASFLFSPFRFLFFDFLLFLFGNNYCKNVQFDRLFLWYFSIYLCINFLPHCMYVFPFFSMAISSITKACRFLFISLPCSRANNPMLSTPYVLFSFLLRAEKSSNTLELL